MRRRIAGNLCALLAGVVLSLVFLEVALRIYNPIVYTVKGDSVVPPVNYDQTQQNAGIQGVAAQAHIHQNSLGFRGADPPADVADRLSIITVGGSTTRSDAQDDDRTWSALLGDAVAGCFERTWINNAGFDGHTSYAHIDLIRNQINKLHPKVVVLLIGANELFVADPRDAGEDSRRLVPPQALINIISPSWVKGYVIYLVSRLEVGNLALTLYRSFRAWKSGFTGGRLDAETDPMPVDGEAQLVAARNGQPQYAERLKLIIRLLRDARTIPVLMTQPALGGSGRDPTTGRDLSRLDFGLFFNEAFEMHNDTMRRVAREEGAYLIDLARLLPKDTRYYYDAMHYTDAGAQKIAQVAAAELLPYLARELPAFKRSSCHLLSAAG